MWGKYLSLLDLTYITKLIFTPNEIRNIIMNKNIILFIKNWKIILIDDEIYNKLLILILIKNHLINILH